MRGDHSLGEPTMGKIFTHMTMSLDGYIATPFVTQ